MFMLCYSVLCDFIVIVNFHFYPIFPCFSVSAESWIKQNWGIVLGVIIGFSAFVGISVYIGWRLFRYRAKYKAEAQKVDEMRDKVKELEEFGTPMQETDDQLIRNPLSASAAFVQNAKRTPQDVEAARAQREQILDKKRYTIIYFFL